MPKIDYKMMREITESDPFMCKWDDFGRRLRYAHLKFRRESKREWYKKLGKLADQARETQYNTFLNICNRSYTGPTIYQPKTLKERLSGNRQEGISFCGKQILMGWEE